MHVRMKVKIGGYRNGEEWPDRGGVLEVPDHEGADLILAGYAEEAHGPDAEPAPDLQPAGDDELEQGEAPAGDDEPAPTEDDDATAGEEPDDDAAVDEAPPAPEVKELRTPTQSAKRTRKP